MALKKLTILPIAVVAVALALASWQGRAAAQEKFVELNGEKFPALAALPPTPIPPDNRQKLDAQGFPVLDDPKVQLGYLLFFDTRLSGDASLSCGTCHEPKEGWGLASTISRGYPGTTHWRNSQTVLNTAYLTKLFWHGQSNALEPQAEEAAQGAVAGNGADDMMEQRLRQVPEYKKKFNEVFGAPWPNVKDAWRAIAAFQRALNDKDTPFDRYMRGDKTALSAKQITGMELFQGKAGCIQCHNGPMLTNEKVFNTGVPRNKDFEKDPLLQTAFRWQHYQRGVPESVYRSSKVDLGVYFNTKVKEDMGKFRTPPLRYLLYVAPYMHDGSIDTLEEVVEFYNKGGGEDLIQKYMGVSTKTKRLKPLNLTKEEKAALVAFLESTTGKEFLLPQPTLPADGVFPAALAKFGKRK